MGNCAAREDEEQQSGSPKSGRFGALVHRGKPQPGKSAITISGFHDEYSGQPRSWMNGRFEPRCGPTYELNFRETYWNEDATLFVFRTAQGKWMINHRDKWEEIKAGGDARGLCSTAIGDIWGAAFTRIYNGERWEDLKGVRVEAFHNPKVDGKITSGKLQVEASSDGGGSDGDPEPSDTEDAIKAMERARN